jgi:hypothetical protein
MAKGKANQMHTDVQEAIDILTRTCNRYGLAVAGFVYGTKTVPLTLYNFGNKKSAGQADTYVRLVALCNKKRELGHVVKVVPPTSGKLN